MAGSKKAKKDEIIQMTQSAFDEVVKELDHRKKVERESIANEISAARELGDLSENHAYTAAMEKKDMNENRITDLEILIKKVKIFKESHSKNIVSIGSTTVITNLKSKKSKTITLTGSEETEAANPLEGKISKDSPVGQAILNSTKGQVVTVYTPRGEVEYRIDKVS